MADNSNYVKETTIREEFKDYRPSAQFEIHVDEQEVLDGDMPKGKDLCGTVGLGKCKVPNAYGLNGNGNDSHHYTGKIDLDPSSETFGMIDSKHGFQNTGYGWAWTNRHHSLGTYQGHNGANDNDKEAYSKILNHPNTLVVLTNKMVELKTWARINGIDEDEMYKSMYNNNEALANIFNEVEPRMEIENRAGGINNICFENRGADTDCQNPQKNMDLITKMSGLGSVTSVDADGNQVIQITNTGSLNQEIQIATDGRKSSTDLNPVTSGISPIHIEDKFKEVPRQFQKSFGFDGIVSLKYPHDAVYGGSGESGQDHMVIEQFRYKPPQMDLLGTKQQQVVGKDNKVTTTGGTSLGKIATGLSRNSNLRDFIGLCKMPIPNQLNFSNGVSWSGERANAVEAAAFFAAQSVVTKGLDEGVGKAMGGALSEFGDLLDEVREGSFKTTQPAGQLLSAFISQYALGRLGINVNPNQFISRAQGVSINPNLELLFNGPKLRSFGFQFNFAPNDEEDASVVRKIQRFFKQGMSPQKNESNLIFLGSPNVFRLRYRTKERDRIKGLPMHKICALTTCEINYAPDNVYQSYDDSKAGSQPIRSTMNLNFTELTPIFESDYRENVESRAPMKNFMQPLEDDDWSTRDLFDTEVDPFQPISTEDTGF